MLAKIRDLHVGVQPDPISRQESDTVHRQDRVLEIVYRMVGNRETGVLDGEGVALESPEIVGVGDQQRKQRMAEICEAVFCVDERCVFLGYTERP